MRIHEYAKNLDISSKDIISFLESNNMSVKNHMSVLGDDVIKMLDKKFTEEALEASGTTLEGTQNNGEKDAIIDTEDLFKYEDYLEVKRPVIKQKKKASNSKKKNKADGEERIANLPVIQDQTLNIVYYSDDLTVGELATRIGKSTGEIIKQLLMLGMMATVNQTLERDMVELIAGEAG
ncbi:MAG: translation initiation factor IF-2 N-terminal domain-containing protein, partial [Turicibacter sp.]